jgi:hypothetical protein
MHRSIRRHCSAAAAYIVLACPMQLACQSERVVVIGRGEAAEVDIMNSAVEAVAGGSASASAAGFEAPEPAAPVRAGSGAVTRHQPELVDADFARRGGRLLRRQESDTGVAPRPTSSTGQLVDRSAEHAEAVQPSAAGELRAWGFTRRGALPAAVEHAAVGSEAARAASIAPANF